MSDSVCCKSFVSEAEIEARKKKRQEEWEKVRKPDDPLEAPEEEYDPRSLFDRLQEQKDLRQSELEESRRLKNLIKGLDDDEVAFLELVDQTKIDMETQLWKEEKKELQEFRRAVCDLTEEEKEEKLRQLRRTLNLQNSGSGKKSQHSLLAGALKRKMSSTSGNAEKKMAPSSAAVEEHIKDEDPSPVKVETTACHESANGVAKSETQTSKTYNTIQCLGVLPGLGLYSDSSNSENSSESEAERDNEFDLVGRRRVLVHNSQERS